MKKVISMILAVAMILSLVPATVAEGPEIEFLLGDVNGDGVLCGADVILILFWDVLSEPTVFDNDERARKAAQIADERHISVRAVGHFLGVITGNKKVVISVDDITSPITRANVKEGMKKLEEVWGEGYNHRLTTCECCVFCEKCDDLLFSPILQYLVNFDGPADLGSSWHKRYCYGLGDVNADGEIDIKDALQTLMYVAGMPSSTLNDNDENLQAALITDKAKEEGEPTI